MHLAAAVLAVSVLAVPTLASAQAGDDQRAQLVEAAHRAVLDGDCPRALRFGARLERIDPAYHDEVFAIDPILEPCRELALGTAPAPLVKHRVPRGRRDIDALDTPKSAGVAMGLSAAGSRTAERSSAACWRSGCCRRRASSTPAPD